MPPVLAQYNEKGNACFAAPSIGRPVAHSLIPRFFKQGLARRPYILLNTIMLQNTVAMQPETAIEDRAHRKRVKKACDRCRLKKSKVRDHPVAHSSYLSTLHSATATRRVVDVREVT